MRFSFKYSGYPLKRPLIKIGFTKKSTPLFEYVALVDSGADMCVLHSSLAKILGIDLDRIRETTPFKGVGKSKRSLSGKWAAVDMMVMQKGKSYKFSSYVLFSEDIPDDGYPLLGMQGFFDQFNSVVFDNDRKELLLNCQDKK